MNTSLRSLCSRGMALRGLLLLATLPFAGAEPPHPILTITGSGSGADSILTTYSESSFLNFAPKGPPRQANPFAPAVVSGDSGWSWSASDPNRIKSTPSGKMFPDTSIAKYQSVSVLSGKTIQVPYYLAAGSSTQKSLVNGAIDNAKRGQLRNFLNTLAPAYINSGSDHASRNQDYARRIAVALDSWATYVPDYYMTEKNGPTFIEASGFTQTNRDIQRASDHNGMAHEWEEDELLAFDAIYDSPALAQLSTEKGYDVRQKIANGIFYDIGDYFKNRVPVSVAINTNLSGSFTVLAKVARVLNRPDYIVWMGDYLDQTIRRKLLRDGVLGEGIGYSYHYLNENYAASEATYDYFSTRPATTTQLATIRDNALMYRTLIERGIDAWDSVRLPNGELPSFGDTVFEHTTTHVNAGLSALLPAYGHLALGTGTDADAVQLNQGFSDDANHMRADVAAYGLWALGTEMLGNIRYSNALPGRQFTEQILAYNAVTVDRSNMSRDSWKVGGSGHKFTSGNLTLFAPGNNGLALTEIDGWRPYANKTSRYQRMMLLNTSDLSAPYVLDVFRVTGGTTHDYTLYGSIRFDQTGESSAPLTAMSGTYPLLENGETWTEPTDSGSAFPYYGVFRNVGTGKPSGNFQITFRDTGSSNRDLRLWMTSDGSSTVYLGRAPNPTRVNDSTNFYAYWRPALIVRNRVSTGPLNSLFVGVIEPMNNGVSTIASVRRVPLTTSTTDAVAVEVKFTSGRVDTYLINLNNPRIYGNAGGSTTIATADGKFSLTGRVGACLQPAPNTGDGRVWAVAASSFKHPAGTYTPGQQVFSGNILGVTRKADGAANDAFIVDAGLPTGTALQGRQLSLTFGTYQVVGSTATQENLSEMYEIDHVEVVNGQTYVVLASDPQLTISGSTTTELVAPQRTFSGTNTFEIARSASASVTLDTTPPALLLPGNLVAEATGPTGAVVNFTASATDNVDGNVPVTLSKASGSVFPLGVTTVTASAMDSAGNTTTGSFTVTVRDTTAPTLTNLSATPSTLDTSGSLVAVTVQASSTDVVDPTPTVKIVSVSSQPTDPNTATTPDWQITGAMTVNLRAEGSGRVYTITVESRDDAGNAQTTTTQVTVAAPSSLFWEAESLTRTSSGATTALQSDTNTSNGTWVALQADGVGDYVDFTLPSVPAGTYQLKMAYKGHPNRGILSLKVDGTQVGSNLDQYDPNSVYPEKTFGNVTFGSAGTHVIRLTVTGRNASAGAYTLSADTFTFVPVTVSTIQAEAEALAVTSSGASTTPQTDANTSGGTWIALQADGVGDYMEFTLPNVPAGTYQLKMRYKGHPNRGILSLKVDGTQVGSTLDQYNSTSVYPEQTFGTVTFATTGNHTIRLTVTGRNAAAGAYTLSADAFTLAP